MACGSPEKPYPGSGLGLLSSRRPAQFVAASSFVLLASFTAEAQTAQAIYQQEKPYQFIVDGMYRQEWTKDLTCTKVDDPEEIDESCKRNRFQLRPRLELGTGAFTFGVGGDFSYSNRDNTVPGEGLTGETIIRDNYKSEDARLDIAFLRIETDWFGLEGGRMLMPVGLTEMIWDRDLRPQGGAVSLGVPFGDAGQFGITGLYSKGSHVFEDDETTMWMASGIIDTGAFELIGSFIRFEGLDGLDPRLRRQNSRRLDGSFRLERYDVFDVVLRLRKEGEVPTELVADFSWNLEANDNNRGTWLALILGDLATSRGRLAYTYANIDQDATVGAYNTDDFIWATGWEGHRAELEVKGGNYSSVAGVAQWQRFKIAPDTTVSEKWVKRYRLELRIQY